MKQEPSEIQRIRHAIEDATRVLTAARGDAERILDATMRTSTDVMDFLGGTATGADEAMVSALTTAGHASRETIGRIDDAVHSLRSAERDL